MSEYTRKILQAHLDAGQTLRCDFYVSFDGTIKPSTTITIAR